MKLPTFSSDAQQVSILAQLLHRRLTSAGNDPVSQISSPTHLSSARPAEVSGQCRADYRWREMATYDCPPELSKAPPISTRQYLLSDHAEGAQNRAQGSMIPDGAEHRAQLGSDN